MLALQVRMDVVRPPSGEEHLAMLKAACGEMLTTHHAENTDRHFQPGNNVRYGYKRRRDKYMWKKLAQTGQNVDLVFSGQSRRRCTGAITPQTAAAGTADKEIVHGHFSLHFDWSRASKIRPRRKRGKKPTHIDAGGNEQAGRKKVLRNVSNADMKRELSSWADAEVKDAVDRLARHYMEHVQREASKRHVTLGGRAFAPMQR